MTVVYDVETFPNVFTLSACTLGKPANMMTWEVSERRNDLASLLDWLWKLSANRVEMVGFNNLWFDYPVIHYIMGSGVTVTPTEIFAVAVGIIRSEDRFGSIIWENDRKIPQIDLFRIHHFDNPAKRTSLKKLQFNMRSASVEDMPFENEQPIPVDQIDKLISYNRHDVSETDKFAGYSAELIKFRRELVTTGELTGDVLNFNDTKIGKQKFIQELGDNLCYTKINGKRQPRQTHRSSINAAEIIFPYIHFNKPEFRNVLDQMRAKVITNTRGSFDVHATVDGFTFDFGTGGIHGSVERRKVISDRDFVIVDIDVTSLYPSIAIVNRLYPAHLGETFVTVYSELKKRRVSFKKGTAPNAMLKLANNGVYGDSNNVYSPFYDPQYTMSVTINGQLLMLMLAEWLLTSVIGIELIQINTDGITARVPRDMLSIFNYVCKEWERFTLLDLEHAQYNRMFIRDVNNYIAESAVAGKRPKLKGAYFYPRDMDEYSGEWDMNFSEMVVQKAAEAAMLHGIAPEDYINWHADPFDFMSCAKATGDDKIMLGSIPMPRTVRYYIATDGERLTKVAPPPPGAILGEFKRKSKISDADYYRIRAATPAGEHNPEIHTGNKSVYEFRHTEFNAGWLAAECNVATTFDWNRLDRRYYIEEARKLIIN